MTDHINKIEEFEVADGKFINCSGQQTEHLKQKIAKEGFSLMRDVHILIDENRFKALVKTFENDRPCSFITSAFGEKLDGHIWNKESLYNKLENTNIPSSYEELFMYKLGKDIKIDELIVSFEEANLFGKRTKHLQRKYDRYIMTVKRIGVSEQTLTFYIKKPE